MVHERLDTNLTQLITFDCYGTLIDWDTAMRAYLSPLLQSKGLEIDVSEFHRIWYYEHALPALHGPFVLYRALLERSLRAAFERFSAELSPRDASEFAEAMAAAEPFPEAPQILRRLRTRFKLGTISNSQDDLLRHASRALGEPFDFAISAETTRAYKPDPALFELIMKRAGVEPKEVVHVAQSQYVDLPRSVPMGIPTVWVNRNDQQLQPGVPSPDATIDDLLPLPSVLGLSDVTTNEGTS